MKEELFFLYCYTDPFQEINFSRFFLLLLPLTRLNDYLFYLYLTFKSIKSHKLINSMFRLVCVYVFVCIYITFFYFFIFFDWLSRKSGKESWPRHEWLVPKEIIKDWTLSFSWTLPNSWSLRRPMLDIDCYIKTL